MTTAREAYVLPEPAVPSDPYEAGSCDLFSATQMQAARKAGRESMREEVAKKFDSIEFADIAKTIREIES